MKSLTIGMGKEFHAEHVNILDDMTSGIVSIPEMVRDRLGVNRFSVYKVFQFFEGARVRSGK